MTLPTIEIPQPDLPSPLPTEHQALMNVFYDYWQALSAKVRENNAALCEGCNELWVNPQIEGMLRSPNQAEIAAVMPPKVNAAVILGNMHYQIGNGGWAQYDDNGYSESIDAARALYEGGVSVGVENADKVVAIIDEFRKRKGEADKPGGYYGYDEDDESQDDGDIYDDLDTRYYAIDGEPLMQDILDRFEEITSYSFLAGAYTKRKAA